MQKGFVPDVFIAKKCTTMALTLIESWINEKPMIV